jgi:hypothetical protein
MIIQETPDYQDLTYTNCCCLDQQTEDECKYVLHKRKSNNKVTRPAPAQRQETTKPQPAKMNDTSAPKANMNNERKDDNKGRQATQEKHAFISFMSNNPRV